MQLLDFNKEFSKKDSDLKQMWGTLSGLIHWMLDDEPMFIREPHPLALRWHLPLVEADPVSQHTTTASALI